MTALPFGLWDVGESFNHTIDMEEEEQEQYQISDEKKIKYELVNLNNLNETNVNGRTMVISCDSGSTAFMEVYFNPSFMAVAKGSFISTPRNSSQPTCYLYQLADFLFCQCHFHIQPEDCYALVTQLISAFELDNIILLATEPKSKFHGVSELEEYNCDVMRLLRTSACNAGSSKTPYLEEGNVIGDFPAAVLSYCEMYGISATLYINYIESQYVDGFTLKTFANVFQDDLMKLMPKVDDETIFERLKNVQRINVDDKNLYI